MPTQNTRKRVQLFFINGDSTDTGVFTAESSTWRGRALSFSREKIDDALTLSESLFPCKSSGVYLLLKKDELAYIGHARNLAGRIRYHDDKKDWWDRAVLVTRDGAKLHTTQIEYLELRLIEKAKSIKRVALDNANTPNETDLPEAEKEEMDTFLNGLYFVLPIMGINMFVKKRPRGSAESDSASSTTGRTCGEQTKIASRQLNEAPSVVQNENSNKGSSAVNLVHLSPAHRGGAMVNRESSPTFEIKFPKMGLVAKMEVRGDKFVVKAGSDARKEWRNPGAENTMPTEENYNKLVESGVLVLTAQGDKRKFTADSEFKHPSRAGGIILGGGCNGNTAWKIVGTKETYGEWKKKNRPKKK